MSIFALLECDSIDNAKTRVHIVILVVLKMRFEFTETVRKLL